MLTRRTALFGLGGALVLACGGALGRLATGYSLPPGDAPIGLSEKELAIVRAIVEALCPAEPDLPGGLELGVHQRIDEEVWSMAPDLADDVRSAVNVIEMLPLVAGFGGRFTHLPVERRLEAFSWMLASGPRAVGQAASALKQMCSLFLYTREETWAAIGYDGPWIATARPPPSSVAYAALLAERRGA